MSIGNIEIPGVGSLPPLGYSPFAAGPSPASLIRTFNVNAGVPTIDAASFAGAGARIIVLQRRLNSVELDSVAGTTFAFATATGGASILPVMAVSTQSNTSIAGYNTSEGLGVRFIGGAADLIAIQGMDNTVGPQDRVYNQLAAALVNGGTFALAKTGLILRQTFRPIFLGVAGTDINNYVQVSVVCVVIVP